MATRNDPNALALTLWREACRNVEIGEFIANVGATLCSIFGLISVELREFDLAAGEIVTLASTQPIEDERRAASAAELRRLHRWAEAGELSTSRQVRAREPALLRLFGATHPDACLFGALAGEHGARGLLLLELPPRTSMDAARCAQLHSLLDAFSAALDNHHRVHELEARRVAAEASRQQLALRLGRDPDHEPVIGIDGGMRDVMERVRLVRTSDVPVLILGETGAGKELVAREIHSGSKRAKAPFLRVNCGAFPVELIDSELFGHEKGAFTGASALRKGWFERADKGTLFLDEIGELPLAAQVRLLRVLQDGNIQRVGGEQSVHVDVRIVAATHRDLPTMVQDGRFRADLWYRIATFPVVLPPLRERREDIPELARHFAERAAARFGLRAQQPSEAALALLARYAWPGNVRELQAVIDRATILGNGERLEIATALGMPSIQSAAADGLPHTGSIAQLSERTLSDEQLDGALIATLDQAMRKHIERALRSCNGRIEGRNGAATLLDINPHTLRARMRRLGVARGAGARGSA